MGVSSRSYPNSDLLWSAQLLAEKMDTAGAVVIDTRPAELYSNGHIPGAKHFDPYFVNTDDTDDAPL